MKRPNVRLHVYNIGRDIRSPEQRNAGWVLEQIRADAAFERNFKRRVAENVERRRLERQ
jgi:hypothetical protein